MEEQVIAALGRRLRELRQTIGLSQEKFAARAGLDRTYYARMERGERNPSVKQLAKIAYALSVPVAALFAESDQHIPGEDAMEQHCAVVNPSIGPPKIPSRRTPRIVVVPPAISVALPFASTLITYGL